MIIVKPTLENLSLAVAVLNKEGVIVCPTDTVYGFLADASSKKAVDKIYKIKKRPKSKPLPFFVKDLKIAKGLAEINKDQEKVLKKFWPGKYTFILKRKTTRPGLVGKYNKIYGVAKGTIAIRIPKHEFLNTLLKKINRPLVQTSVNISGEPALVKKEDIIKKFGNSKNILIINGGKLKKSKPSQVMDLTSKYLTRIR